MCIPLAVAAGVTAAAGTVLGGYSSMLQGNYQQKVADQNAALEMERTRDSQSRGRQEALRFYRDLGRLKGEQAAAMAANGIDLGEGTALRVQQDTAALGEEDVKNLYSNIYERTRGFEINAANIKAEGRAAKAKGRSDMVGSVFQGASSIMGGFQQQRALKAKIAAGD